MPLVGAEAALWHRAQMEAYRHCLDMLGYPTEADEAVLNRIIAGSPAALPTAAYLLFPASTSSKDLLKFEGNHCRYFSASSDQPIQRPVGTRPTADFLYK